MSNKRSTKVGLVAAVAMVLCILFAGTALAQSDPYGEGKPDVKGTILQNGDPGEGSVESDTVARDETDVAGDVEGAILPFTGGQVTLFLVLGAGAVLLGSFIVRKTKTTN